MKDAMSFVEDMSRILSAYGLWLRETKGDEPMKFAIMSLSGPLAYLDGESEVTSYIAALYAVRKGRIWLGKG
jgi:hypothetical protein